VFSSLGALTFFGGCGEYANVNQLNSIKSFGRMRDQCHLDGVLLIQQVLDLLTTRQDIWRQKCSSERRYDANNIPFRSVLKGYVGLGA
jgi:hypothetical protein